MSSRTFGRFLELLQAQLPGHPVVVHRYQSPDDPTIEHFVDILLVPTDDLHEVAMRAWDLAFDVFGDLPIPFLMTTVSTESSRRFFAKELADAGGAR